MFVYSLIATLVVVGSYLGVVLEALWFGEGDMAFPVKVAFLGGVVMIIGYSIVTTARIVMRRQWDHLYPAAGALILELLVLWVAGGSISNFLASGQSLVDLTTLSPDLRLLTTLGLGTVVVFFLVSARYMLSPAGIDIRRIVMRTSPSLLLLIITTVGVGATIALQLLQPQQYLAFLASIFTGGVSLALNELRRRGALNE